MLRFLSKVYRGIKIFVATLGCLTGTGAIITGVIMSGGAGIVLIVGGSIWTAASLFTLFDSVAVHSIIARDVKKLERNVDTFAKENNELSESVNVLSEAKKNYIEQNIKLAESVRHSEKQIKKLSDIKTQYTKVTQKYEKLLKNEKKQIIQLENQNVIYIEENEKIRKNLNQMKALQDEFSKENNILKELIEQNEHEMDELETIKNSYVDENNKLQKQNEENAKQVSELNTQVDKLKGLYKNSVELMKNLANAGDMFNSFNDVISNNVVDLNTTKDDLESVSNKMEILTSRLRDSKFGDMDKDNDGIISKDEFDDYIGSGSSTTA